MKHPSWCFRYERHFRLAHMYMACENLNTPALLLELVGHVYFSLWRLQCTPWGNEGKSCEEGNDRLLKRMIYNQNGIKMKYFNVRCCFRLFNKTKAWTESRFHVQRIQHRWVSLNWQNWLHIKVEKAISNARFNFAKMEYVIKNHKQRRKIWTSFYYSLGKKFQMSKLKSNCNALPDGKQNSCNNKTPVSVLTVLQGKLPVIRRGKLQLALSNRSLQISFFFFSFHSYANLPFQP